MSSDRDSATLDRQLLRAGEDLDGCHDDGNIKYGAAPSAESGHSGGEASKRSHRKLNSLWGMEWLQEAGELYGACHPKSGMFFERLEGQPRRIRDYPLLRAWHGKDQKEKELGAINLLLDCIYGARTGHQTGLGGSRLLNLGQPPHPRHKRLMNT